MEKKVALSIAGSDSSGGAGIQADLKSFSYLGVHGTTVITCVTSQNTRQVSGIYKVPVDVIHSQLESVLQDLPIAAVKTGMLYDDETIQQVAKTLVNYHLKPVVDPVMVATSGDSLTHGSFVSSLKHHLLPNALMVTANVPEASSIAGIPIETQQDVRDACKKIYSLGPAYVLLKGGHLKGDDAIDVLYDGRQYHTFTLPKIPNKKAHGSGCTLSALITGLLALGESPVEAVRKAKYIAWGMIQEGYSPGKGSDVLNHSSRVMVPPFALDETHAQVWVELKNAVDQLISLLPVSFIPEVGLNFVYACPNATSRNDVCGICGRIVKYHDTPHLCGSLDFGASKHVASIVLAAQSFDTTVRSAVNIRYSKESVNLCKKIGFTVGTFERKDESATAPSTMEWGTSHAISTLGRVPDIIYDIGSIGKEPMIRILGKNPADVLAKLKKLVASSEP